MIEVVIEWLKQQAERPGPSPSMRIDGDMATLDGDFDLAELRKRLKRLKTPAEDGG